MHLQRPEVSCPGPCCAHTFHPTAKAESLRAENSSRSQPSVRGGAGGSSMEALISFRGFGGSRGEKKSCRRGASAQTFPQETGCLLSKQAVATDTPAPPSGARDPPPPPAGHIRALLYKILTSRRPRRWVHLKPRPHQSGAEGSGPSPPPRRLQPMGKEVDITRQSAWLLERERLPF